MNDYAIILRDGIGRSGLPNEKKLLYDAIKKQISQAPILQGDGYADGKMVYDIWYCPNCDTAYEVEVQYNHCPWCGQRLNWDEQEESEE